MTNPFSMVRKTECHMRSSQGVGLMKFLRFRNQETSIAKLALESDIHTCMDESKLCEMKYWKCVGGWAQWFLKRRPKFDL